MTGIEKRARVLGAAAGLALAVVVVAGWAMPGGSAPAGADVRLTTGPTGELAVAPGGPLLAATGMRPGTERRGSPFVVRNQTPIALLVTPRATPAVSDLDDDVLVELAVDGAPIGKASLRGLRAGGAGSFVLAPGQARTLTARAELVGTVTDYQGRWADVAVHLETTPVGR